MQSNSPNNANSKSRALQIIDIFQKYQFREISSNELEETFKDFPYKNTFLSLLENIFRRRVPTYQDYDPTYERNSHRNPLLDRLSVCTDSSHSDKRMKNIIKLLTTTAHKSCFDSCVAELSSPLHFQEAKFYADLFGGSRFGFSRDQVNKLLELHSKPHIEMPEKLATWVMPKKVKSSYKAWSFPVFVEPFYHGFLFKLVSKNGKIRIFSDYNREVTGCFPDFQKLESVLPDKTSTVDFILANNSSRQFNLDLHRLIDRCIYCNSPINVPSCAIILLDFYWEGDKKDLAFRKQRMSKLRKRVSKLNVTPFILGDSASLVENADELRSHITHYVSGRSTGCLIREAASRVTSKTQRWYKVLPQHSRETVKLVDYKYSYIPNFRLDIILGETEDNKQIVLNSRDQPQYLMRNIVSLMGRHANIYWEEESEGEFKPVIFSILPETSRF